jgi:hypothetical protein
MNFFTDRMVEDDDYTCVAFLTFFFWPVMILYLMYIIAIRVLERNEE